MMWLDIFITTVGYIFNIFIFIKSKEKKKIKVKKILI